MKKSRWTLTVAIGAVIAGLGIAAAAYLTSTSVEAQSTELPRTIAWMPASASVVGHVDLRSLLNSPLREKWEQELRRRGEQTGLDEFREKTGLDPFSDIHGATFAVVPAEEGASGSAGGPPMPERWGAAIHGSFDSERLLAKMTEAATVETEEYDGSTIYHVTRNVQNEGEHKKPEPALVFAERNILLIGEPNYLKEMLDTGAGRSTSATPALTDRWGEGNFAQDTFWVAASPESGLGRMMPQGGEIPPIRSLAVSGRLEADLALRARGRAADVAAATKLADVVRGFVALGSLQRGENPDLGAVLDSIQIDQVDDEVEISLSVSYETLERLSQQGRKTEAELN